MTAPRVIIAAMFLKMFVKEQENLEDSDTKELDDEIRDWEEEALLECERLFLREARKFITDFPAELKENLKE